MMNNPNRSGRCSMCSGARSSRRVAITGPRASIATAAAQIPYRTQPSKAGDTAHSTVLAAVNPR